MGRFDDDRDMACGNCRFNRYDREKKDFYCGNRGSDSHGASTAYDDSCQDWEVKEK